MIDWGVKSDIAHRDPRSQRHTEGLNGTIKILVIERVFIMPNASHRACHLVGNECTAIDSRLGLDRVDGRSRPGGEGSGRSHRGSHSCKGETRRAADAKLAVGRIIIHVALPCVTLAPGVLMRSDVLRFGEIGRPGILRRRQVAHFYQNPVRCAAVSVARVAGCTRWEDAGKGIYPSTRTQATLTRI